MLLYVHTPFCRSKCRYCSFYSKVFDMGEVESFTASLAAEMRYWGERLGRPEVRTVYFGGGTPSLLPEWALGGIFPVLRECFRIREGAEFTFEANPDSAADAAYFRLLLDHGVNRLSLGVQSLDDDALRMLGRPHTAGAALASYGQARRAGFGNIGLDLLWGLPGQRPWTWLGTLREIVKLRPEHLSCYGLTLEPGTALEAAVSDGELALPPEKEQAAMFVQGAEMLEGEGYLQYEVSNFSRMGFQSRHNMGYWEGEDYLGLGPSAVSTLGGVRRENPRDLGVYGRQAKEGGFGAGGERLTEEERISEFVMLSLRTSRGLDLKAYRKMTGRNFLGENERLVQALRANELIRISGGRLRLDRKSVV